MEWIIAIASDLSIKKKNAIEVFTLLFWLYVKTKRNFYWKLSVQELSKIITLNKKIEQLREKYKWIPLKETTCTENNNKTEIDWINSTWNHLFQ